MEFQRGYAATTIGSDSRFVKRRGRTTGHRACKSKSERSVPNSNFICEPFRVAKAHGTDGSHNNNNDLKKSVVSLAGTQKKNDKNDEKV